MLSCGALTWSHWDTSPNMRKPGNCDVTSVSIRAVSSADSSSMKSWLFRAILGRSQLQSNIMAYEEVKRRETMWNCSSGIHKTERPLHLNCPSTKSLRYCPCESWTLIRWFGRKDLLKGSFRLAHWPSPSAAPTLLAPSSTFFPPSVTDIFLSQHHVCIHVPEAWSYILISDSGWPKQLHNETCDMCKEKTLPYAVLMSMTTC